jgi:glycosyltransferase involved in cell wall biosynthesis
MTPIISVVIATYRAGEYLRQAVASALGQSFTDLEVVVSDDAADPAVRELVEAFADPRVRYRSNPTRLGPAGNHWAAFAECHGRYIAILNHDDLWHPAFLATLVPPLEADSDVTVAFCDHEVIDPDGRTLTEASDDTSRKWGRTGLAPGRHQPFRDLVVSQTLPVAMGAVFRRSAVDPATLSEVGPAYDLWLAYLLARGGGAAWYTPNRVSRWRVHPAQLTGRADLSWAVGSLACWQAMADDTGFAPFRRQVSRSLARCAIGAARAAAGAGQPRQSRAFARLAVRTDPLHWRAWAVAAWSLLPAGRRRPTPAAGS